VGYKVTVTKPPQTEGTSGHLVRAGGEQVEDRVDTCNLIFEDYSGLATAFSGAKTMVETGINSLASREDG